MVRLGRAKRGMSRRQLAQESGTSERYLAQIESGAGNPSVLVMRAIADALEIPLFELLPQTGGARRALCPDHRSARARASPSDLAAIADTIERRIDGAAATDRGRRIALVGLRGAGKSTLGKHAGRKARRAVHRARPHGRAGVWRQRAAADRECPASPPSSGIERACLERVISENEAAVIATAGGIVSNPETYGLLLRRTHTVWISAQPEEHMSRVMKQGDFRPMARNREAMADLHAILEARRGDYARAEATLDTSGATVQQSFAKLAKLVAPWMKG